MADTGTGNWTFHHIGLVVADLDKTISYLQSLGMYEFQPENPPASYQEFVAYGKPIVKDRKLVHAPDGEIKPSRIRFCNLGTLAYEIIQPFQSFPANVNKDFLNTTGEGISHIGYGVPPGNFEDEVEKMQLRGAALVQSGKSTNGGEFAYFDTSGGGNVITELMIVFHD